MLYLFMYARVNSHGASVVACPRFWLSELFDRWITQNCTFGWLAYGTHGVHLDLLKQEVYSAHCAYVSAFGLHAGLAMFALPLMVVASLACPETGSFQGIGQQGQGHRQLKQSSSIQAMSGTDIIRYTLHVPGKVSQEGATFTCTSSHGFVAYVRNAAAIELGLKRTQLAIANRTCR